ncbi:unnamed protein product [Cunninghamella blakesleeana]
MENYGNFFIVTGYATQAHVIEESSPAGVFTVSFKVYAKDGMVYKFYVNYEDIDILNQFMDTDSGRYRSRRKIGLYKVAGVLTVVAAQALAGQCFLYYVKFHRRMILREINVDIDRNEIQAGPTRKVLRVDNHVIIPQIPEGHPKILHPVYEQPILQQDQGLNIGEGAIPAIPANPEMVYDEYDYVYNKNYIILGYYLFFCC